MRLHPIISDFVAAAGEKVQTDKRLAYLQGQRCIATFETER
jgi:hypothetical protein